MTVLPGPRISQETVIRSSFSSQSSLNGVSSALLDAHKPDRAIMSATISRLSVGFPGGSNPCVEGMPVECGALQGRFSLKLRSTSRGRAT